MKHVVLHIYFLVFGFLVANAQGKPFSISGNINACETHKAMKGVTLKLIGSDGSCVNTLTDSTGNYLFGNAVIKTNRTYVLTTEVTKEVGNFVNTSEKFKFTTWDSISIRNLRKDFCLHNGGCILSLPTLYFAKNSVTNYSAGEGLDLNALYLLMMDNPTFVVEITAHNSMDEKNSLELSQHRAEYLQDTLIKKGIEKARLTIKVAGNTEPEVTMDEIRKLKTKKEREEAFGKNRRVVFNVVRKNYVPENAKREK